MGNDSTLASSHNTLCCILELCVNIYLDDISRSSATNEYNAFSYKEVLHARRPGGLGSVEGSSSMLQKTVRCHAQWHSAASTTCPCTYEYWSYLNSTSSYISTCVASFSLLNVCGACILSKLFSLSRTWTWWFALRYFLNVHSLEEGLAHFYLNLGF